MYILKISPPAPQSEDGSAGGVQGEECRAVRALKPRRTARILEGRNRAEISLSFFEFFSGGAHKRKIVRENFCEVAAGAIAEAGGGARAYDLGQSHHALRACVRRSVQNMFEQSRIIPHIYKSTFSGAFCFVKFTLIGRRLFYFLIYESDNNTY